MISRSFLNLCGAFILLAGSILSLSADSFGDQTGWQDLPGPMPAQPAPHLMQDALCEADENLAWEKIAKRELSEIVWANTPFLEMSQSCHDLRTIAFSNWEPAVINEIVACEKEGGLTKFPQYRWLSPLEGCSYQVMKDERLLLLFKAETPVLCCKKESTSAKDSDHTGPPFMVEDPSYSSPGCVAEFKETTVVNRTADSCVDYWSVPEDPLARDEDMLAERAARINEGAEAAAVETNFVYCSEYCSTIGHNNGECAWKNQNCFGKEISSAYCRCWNEEQNPDPEHTPTPAERPESTPAETPAETPEESPEPTPAETPEPTPEELSL